MVLPPVSPGMSADVGGPDGHSYGAVLLRSEASHPIAATGADAAPDVAGILHGLRFSGWVAPPDRGWTVILGDPGAGVVARGRRGIVEVAGAIAAAVAGPVVAVQVRRDRQLGIVAWLDGVEIARYCSDPSVEPGADREVLSDPVGEEDAEALATALGRSAAAEELRALLAEELDPDSVFESERLRSVLRVMGMPEWLVAAGSLPHDIPTGPRAAELTRLRAGETGPAALAAHGLIKKGRRRHAPPPIIDDPPRQNDGGMDPWLL
jgi:hypothetical protein